MLRALRLTATVLLGLAGPALAQTTITSPAASLPPTRAANHPPASVTAPSTQAAHGGGKIDLNGASETDLASLPGIGSVTAKKIVQGRPWDDEADLVKKKVMSQAVFDKNKDRFALANINTSSAADMAKTLPGIGDKTAPKIVSGRPYASPQDLVTKGVLTAAQLAKVKDVIAY